MQHIYAPIHSWDNQWTLTAMTWVVCSLCKTCIVIFQRTLKLLQMTEYDGKLEIAYSITDNTPAYLVISPGMYSSVFIPNSAVILNSFSGVAPSYSTFELPYQCSMAKKSKVTKGKAKGKKPRFQPNNIFHKPKHIWMRTNWTKKLEQVWQQCIVL